MTALARLTAAGYSCGLNIQMGKPRSRATVCMGQSHPGAPTGQSYAVVELGRSTKARGAGLGPAWKNYPEAAPPLSG